MDSHGDLFVGHADIVEELADDLMKSGDVVTDVQMETSVFVVNTLRPLSQPNDDNKLTRDDDSLNANQGAPSISEVNLEDEAFGES